MNDSGGPVKTQDGQQTASSSVLMCAVESSVELEADGNSRPLCGRW